MARNTNHIFVFDAYGTLFDVHSAISKFRGTMGPDADRLSDIWRTKQLEYTWTLTLAGHYADFWTLTERALDYALERVPSAPKGIRTDLLEAYFRLEAFPDAKRALNELQAGGYKTCILSNGAPKMLQGAIEHAGLDRNLDAVFSVDSLKKFKPRPEVYALVTGHYRCTPGDVTFVSSNRWDVMGANSIGFRALWVNRARMPDEYPDFPPERTLSDLSSIATVT
jgi:2-haloacid dehalogenase